MKLSIQLLTYNGEKYLAPLFESLKNQTFVDFELLILDNASTDSTVNSIKNLIQSFNFAVKLTESNENTGFAKGNNILFKQNKSPYILVINQDAYLSPECLEKMVVFMDKNEDDAALAPRVMKWNFESNIFTDIIDSLGMKIFKNRRVIDIGEGEKWPGISFFGKGESQEVFGVSAGCAMYRRSALESTLYPDGGFFDSTYFMYKEDVDLAYRLQAVGCKSAVLYDAVAYHARTSGRSGGLQDTNAIINKKTQNKVVKHESYKNHLMNLYKNEAWQNLLLDFPWILWYEGKKFLYFLLFDPMVLRGLKEVWKNRGMRKIVQSKIKVGWRGLRVWLK